MNPDLFLVMHLPKTAGSTLRANFIRNFKSEEWMSVLPISGNWNREAIVSGVDEILAQHDLKSTRCAFGHWVYWGLHQRIRPASTPAYIAFLRDPIERGVSFYGYARTRPETKSYHLIRDNNWGIERWMQETHARGVKNGQLRRLLFDGENDVLTEPNLTRDHLEAAKERLREFWFVGLTETFETDSLYLYGKLGFRRLSSQRVINATPDKPIATPEDIAALEAANVWDSELYRFARQLHDEWKLENAREIHVHTRKARLVRTFWENLLRLKQKGAARS